MLNSSSKVDKWDIEMKYENDSEGDATYYTSTFTTTVKQARYEMKQRLTLHFKS